MKSQFTRNKVELYARLVILILQIILTNTVKLTLSKGKVIVIKL